MKKLGGAAVAALSVILLAGCSAPAPEAAPAATSAPAASSVAPVASPSPSVTPTAAATCDSYPPLVSEQADGGAVEAQVAAIALPDGVTLNPGVQTITSVDEPGTFETVVRVCSAPLSEEALIEVGNAIAVPLSQTPAGETVTSLVISGWSPGGATLTKGEAVTTEFQLYTWNPNAAVPLSSNWK